MAVEFLKHIGTRSTKEGNPVKEEAIKYRCLWAFKLNCNMGKHQVSQASFISWLNERICFVWVCLVLIRSNKKGKSRKPIHHKILLVHTLGILHNLSTLNSCWRDSLQLMWPSPHTHIGKGNQSYIKRAVGLQDHKFLVPKVRAQALSLVCLLTEMQTNTGSTLSIFWPIP